MYREKRRSKFLVGLILVILATAISGLVSYYYTKGASEVEKKKIKEELQGAKDENDKLKVENEQLKAQAETPSANSSQGKVYTDEKNGYSFAYPSSWFVTSDSEGLILTSFKYPGTNGTELKNDQTKIVINIKANSQKLTPKAWSVNAIGENTTILQKGDLQVGGKDAYKLQTKDNAGTITSIFVAKTQTKILEIINYGSDKELTNIINSFKFL